MSEIETESHIVFRKISFEETEKGQPFTREQLAEWGVNYPPRKGWRIALARGEDPNTPPQPRANSKAVASVQ